MFLQTDIGKFLPFPASPGNMLASEVAALLMTSQDSSCNGIPEDKLENTSSHHVQTARQQATQVDQHQAQLAGMPDFIHELFQHYAQGQPLAGDDRRNVFFIETWYSDHTRRPHSGLGRQVRLTADFSTWYTSIVMAWEDHVDPFHSLTGHIVQPHPAGGDPEVLAHVVLVQNAIPDQVSTLVSIFDADDDPWHPRLLCLTLHQQRLFQTLLDVANPGDEFASISTMATCRAWWHDQEITAHWRTLLPHGAGILLHIQRAPAPVNMAHHVDDDDDDDGLQLLQKNVKATVVSLQDHIEAPANPVWVHVDCHKTLFVRQQLLHFEEVHVQTCTQSVRWKETTSFCPATHCPMDLGTSNRLHLLHRWICSKSKCNGYCSCGVGCPYASRAAMGRVSDSPLYWQSDRPACRSYRLASCSQMVQSASGAVWTSICMGRVCLRLPTCCRHCSRTAGWYTQL